MSLPLSSCFFLRAHKISSSPGCVEHLILRQFIDIVSRNPKHDVLVAELPCSSPPSSLLIAVLELAHIIGHSMISAGSLPSRSTSRNRQDSRPTIRGLTPSFLPSTT